jgi:hypothetical protein
MGLNRNLGNLTEVITEGGGNIGIGGTPNAGFRVDVNGTGRFSSTVQASAFRLTGMTAGSGALYWSSDRVTLANYNPTGVVMIEANGGAAVATFGGTTFNNDFVGTGRFSGNVAINGSSLDINPSSGNPNITLRTGNTFRGYIEGNSNGLSFGAGASANIYFTLLNNGNVGIGTTSPTTRLEVSSSDLNNIFVTNPNTSGATTGSGVGFKAFNGTSVTQSAGIILTSNTWSFGTYSTNQLSIGSDGTGGAALRTANSAPITFFTGGTTAGLSTERMRITSGGNVGIGTTSPNTLLEVASTTSNAARIRVNNTSTTAGQYRGYEFASGSTFKGGFLQDQNTDLISIFTPVGGQSVNITSGGNVGIGTTNATGQSSDNRVLQIYGAGFANRAQIHFVNVNTGEGTSDGTFIGIDSNKEFFINNTEGATIFENSGSERMRIFSSGNVFIGPSPSDNGARLQVSGAATFSSSVTSSNYFEISVGRNSKINGNGAYIYRSTDGGVNYPYNSNGHLVLEPRLDSVRDIVLMGSSATPIAVFQGGGKLLIGTTTAGFGLFSEQRVTINPTNDGITIGPLTQNKSAYTLQSDNNTGTRYALYIANGSGDPVGNVSFTSSATSYNTTSDYRLKQDLKSISGLDLVSQIKVYDYQWKLDETRAYGVLAHELQEVMPQAVNGEKDGEQMQGVDYSKLVPILVQAIQELKAEIEILKQNK